MSQLTLFGTLLVLLVGTTWAYPSPTNHNFTVFRDPENGFKYMWWPMGDGEMVKAYLEGGPAPKKLEEITLDDVQFYLFTKSNPSTGQELRPGCVDCLQNSNFDRNAPVKIICHGFTNDYQSDINQVMRSAYLQTSTFMNIIHINWEKLAAAPWYDTAAANVLPVGQYAGQFVDFLVSSGYTTYDKVHFSGHSLGSHVGGHCGSSTAQKFARITALDPALPLFGEQPDSGRIDPTDANFVDVIHTAGGSLAFLEARGHADFYPNNGAAYQPGCGIDIIATCSHSRAYEFMGESIWHTNGFPSYKCNNWEEYDTGRCPMTEMVYMGEQCPSSARGRFYLRTNEKPPFGQE